MRRPISAPPKKVKSVGMHSLRPNWRERAKLAPAWQKRLEAWQRQVERQLESGWSRDVTLPSDVNPRVHETERTYFSKPRGVRYRSVLPPKEEPRPKTATGAVRRRAGPPSPHTPGPLGSTTRSAGASPAPSRPGSAGFSASPIPSTAMQGGGQGGVPMSPHDHKPSPFTFFAAPDTSGLGAVAQGVPGHDSALLWVNPDAGPAEDVLEGVGKTEEAEMAEALGGWLSAPVTFARTPKQRKAEQRAEAIRYRKLLWNDKKKASHFVINLRIRGTQGDQVVGKRHAGGRRGSVVLNPATGEIMGHMGAPKTRTQARKAKRRARGRGIGGAKGGTSEVAEAFPGVGNVPQPMRDLVATASTRDLLRHNMKRTGARPAAITASAVDGAVVSVFMQEGPPRPESRGIRIPRQEVRREREKMVLVGGGKADAKGVVSVDCYCLDWRLKDCIIRVDPGPGGGHLSPEEKVVRLNSKLTRMAIRLEPREARARRLASAKADWGQSASVRRHFEDARVAYLRVNTRKALFRGINDDGVA